MTNHFWCFRWNFIYLPFIIFTSSINFFLLIAFIILYFCNLHQPKNSSTKMEEFPGRLQFCYRLFVTFDYSSLAPSILYTTPRDKKLWPRGAVPGMYTMAEAKKRLSVLFRGTSLPSGLFLLVLLLSEIRVKCFTIVFYLR